MKLSNDISPEELSVFLEETDEELKLLDEDLILLGAYKRGADQRVDMAIAKIEEINGFLKQATDDKSNFQGSVEQLKKMFPPSAN